MTPDGDELDGLLCVVQKGMVTVRGAMAAEVAMPDERERRRARRDRLEAQLRMLEAARLACRLAIEAPRPPLPSASIHALEERHGFVPGTFAAAVGRPSQARAVLVEQDLDLAIRVTRAELAADDGPIDRAFTAAVFRICCATVIGALVGAPLGALAADENIVLKMAEAAVVVGLGATTAEIIQPLSLRLTRGPAARPEVADYQLATTAVRDLHDVVLPSDLLDDPARGRLKSLDDVVAPDPVTKPDDDPVAAPDDEPEAPDEDPPWRRPIESPVRPPFDDPFDDPF